MKLYHRLHVVSLSRLLLAVTGRHHASSELLQAVAPPPLSSYRLARLRRAVTGRNHASDKRLRAKCFDDCHPSVRGKSMNVFWQIFFSNNLHNSFLLLIFSLINLRDFNGGSLMWFSLTERVYINSMFTQIKK